MYAVFSERLTNELAAPPVAGSFEQPVPFQRIGKLLNDGLRRKRRSTLPHQVKDCYPLLVMRNSQRHGVSRAAGWIAKCPIAHPWRRRQLKPPRGRDPINRFTAYEVTDIAAELCAIFSACSFWIVAIRFFNDGWIEQGIHRQRRSLPHQNPGIVLAPVSPIRIV